MLAKCRRTNKRHRTVSRKLELDVIEEHNQFKYACLRVAECIRAHNMYEFVNQRSNVQLTFIGLDYGGVL